MPEIKKYLNRDGLDEYNSLLPHSSAEMQTYVNEWMDEHPEASTTVQDGAITERKLADKSVSLRTLADDTVHMLKGAILTGNLSGEVLTADDAYSAPPVALTVEGKSTQDGTPTPAAPVEIVSIEQANIHFGDINVLLNLTQALRSLPDGTHDELSFAYLRPSTREGWAWYSRELVQKLHEITLNACTWLLYSATAFYTRGLNLPFSAGNVEVLCNIFKPSASKNLGGLANAEINSIQVLGRNELGIKTASEYQDESAFVASLDDSDVAVAKLAAPITTQLDPIELPVLPAPNCTVWADPTTGLQMEYVRDSNLVIQRIEQAIADQ